MGTINYYFDESGEKGFLNSDFSASDIGLIAGIALPARLVGDFEREIKSILSRLDTNGVKKMHATELFRDGKNQAVKNELLDFLSRRDEWLLIYEAIYPLGLFKHEESVKQSTKLEIESSTFKISQNQRRLRIYTELLEGLFVKLDELCRISTSSDELVMISDQIDTGIYQEAVQALKNLKQEVYTERVSGFDIETKETHLGKIEAQIEGIDATIRYIPRIEINESSNLITVADIISNTLYRHLKSVVKTNPNIRLHSHAAISGFHLANKIAFVDDHDVSDILCSPFTNG